MPTRTACAVALLMLNGTLTAQLIADTTCYEVLYQAKVKTLNGEKWKGAIIQVTNDALILSSGVPPRRHVTEAPLVPVREIPLNTIRSVVVRGRNAMGRGTAIGAAIGAGLGAIVSVAGGSSGSSGYGPSAESTAPFVIGAPMILGALLGLAGSSSPTLVLERKVPKGDEDTFDREVRDDVFRHDAQELNTYRVRSEMCRP